MAKITFVAAEITLKVAVIISSVDTIFFLLTSSVAKMTFVVAEITFKVAVITSLVAKITFVVAMIILNWL